MPDISEEESDEWEAQDGMPAPEHDAEWSAVDKAWRAACVRKPVFFRWSTAFNSKNKFKGAVTAHKSRQASVKTGARLDYLVIKVFGSSEDRYMMGKDIRELYVLPNKTSLMEPGTEEEIKSRAIRKWTVKDGWIDTTNVDERHESTASTVAETPLICEKTSSSASKRTKQTDKQDNILSQRKYFKGRNVRDMIGKNSEETITVTGPGTVVFTRHGARSMAGRIAGFYFYN